MANGEVIIDVNADTSKYEQAVKTAGNNTEGMMGKAQGASMGLLGAVGIAGAAVAGVGIASVGAAEEAAQANNRLDQIYKQMGDSTGKLSQSAKDYADTLSKQIGVDDEVIKAGQAKLATFSAVSSSAETMARATKAAADLSAAGFGDISSTSVQLGKALQDPIKGMSALGKSGVTFSEQEKELIKQMYEAGDVAGYQEIMFKAVEKQVGGVSEATATMGDKMTVNLGEIQESLGQAFLPIAEAMLPAIESLSTAVGDFFASDWVGKLKEWEPVFYVVGGAILAALLPAIITLIGSMITLAVTTLAALWPFLLIGAAIGGVAYLLMNNWEPVKAFFAGVWDALKSVWEAMKAGFEGFLNAISAFWSGAWEAVKTVAVAIFEGISAFFSAIWAVIQTVFTTYLNVISTIWSTIWNAVKTVVTVIFDAIVWFFESFWNGVTLVFSTALNIISAFWSAVWEGVKTVVTTIFEAIFDFINGVPETIAGGLEALGNLWEKFAEWFGSMKDAAVEKLVALIDWVKGVPKRILDALGDLGKLLYNSGKAIIEGLWNGLKAMWEKTKAWISGIADWIAQNKGPISYDRKLLVKNGVAIMGGFSKGLSQGWSDVQSQIDKYTTSLSGMGFASVANTATQLGASGAGAGANSSVVNYTQNIYTPVTSYGETKRAQREMGMTLAGRLV